MGNCKQIKVRIDTLHVKKSESYGDWLGITGEPGNSAEWSLILTVGGNSQLWEQTGIRDGSKHSIGYDFFVDITNVEKLFISASGVEIDDTSANDTLPEANSSHVPADNWALGQNYQLSAANKDFNYIIEYTITCAESIDTTGQALSTSPILVAGLWRTGQDALLVEVGTDNDSFLKLAQEQFNKNMRLVNINTYKTAEDEPRKWGGVFRSGTGASWLNWNLSTTDFSKLVTDRFKQSLRLLDAKTYFENGAQMWAGVWGPGTDALWFNTGLNEASFHEFNNSQFQKGMRLVSFDCYKREGQRLFSGIWRSGNGAAFCQLNLSLTDFINLANQKHSEGLRLIYMKTYFDNGTRLWGGTWVEGNDSGLFMADLTREDFLNTANEKHKEGMRLIDFEVYK